jgi:methionine-rich copper-binding protein CopC
MALEVVIGDDDEICILSSRILLGDKATLVIVGGAVVNARMRVRVGQHDGSYGWILDDGEGSETVRTMRRFVAGAVLFLVGVTGFAGPASAHDDATSNTPAAGAIVESPDEVTLTFSEEVNPALVTGSLRSSSGENIQLGAGRDGGGTTVALTVPEVLGDGLWTVTWAATSRDSHQVSGAFAFTVDSTATPAAAGTTVPDKPAEKKPVSPYVLLALSVALLVGLSFGVAAARPRRD